MGTEGRDGAGAQAAPHGDGHRRFARRGAAVGGALAIGALTLAAAALAAGGDLVQKAGTAGCVSADGSSGTCAQAEGLFGPVSLAVSPNGNSAYVASSNSDAVAVFDRDTSTGALTQKSGTAGCVSDTGSSGACADGSALDGADSLAVSPDGESAYLTALNSDAVAVFDRDTSTGALTQKAGTAGCVSETGSGPCADGVALDGARSVTVSPDGASVYVTSNVSNAIAVFDRSTTTGALTQKAGTAGCVSDNGTGGACDDGKSLQSPTSLAISPDGSSAYVASSNSAAVAIFDRDTGTGALTQKAGTAGCVSLTGSSGTCAQGVALQTPTSVAVSPDGGNVYAAALNSYAVVIFDRDTNTGAIAQKAGTAGCISIDGTDGFSTPGACADGAALASPSGVAVSSDGSSAYVVASGSDAVAVFERDDAGSGGLSQRPGTAGCISEDGTSGECVNGKALDGASSVALSPDATSLYSVASAAGAVAVFDRSDGVPPETTITSGPEGVTRQASLSFGFSSSEVASSFECRLDAAPFAPCASPQAYSGIGQGPHTFAVRAIDRGGEADPSAAQRSFTLDSKAAGSASAKKTQKQKGKKVAVAVEVKGSEQLGAEAGGKLKLGKKSYKLKPQSAQLGPGGSKVLKLKPKGQQAKIAKALRQGKKGKASLTVKLTDALGNAKTAKLTVTLKA